MSAHPIRASLVLITSVALIFSFLAIVSIKPAHSATCTDLQSGTFNNGSTGGGTASCDGDGGTITVNDPLAGIGTWVIDQVLGVACTNRVGAASQTAIVHKVINGIAGDPFEDCLVNYGTVTVPTIADVKAQVKAPKITTDYEGDLLVGAPVKFSTAEPGTVTKTTALGTIKLVPTKYEWNFGDGTTSTEANPLHTYSTIKDESGDLEVSFTVTYQVSLTTGPAVDNAGAALDLGPIALTSNIGKHIVEVWAALTPEAR